MTGQKSHDLNCGSVDLIVREISKILGHTRTNLKTVSGDRI